MQKKSAEKMSNQIVAARSRKSNDPTEPTRPSPSTSPSSVTSSFAWAEGRELLSQGVGSRLELVRTFTSTSGFWARWFRYLVLLALAARVLHHSARLFKHYGQRFFRAVRWLGGSWAKGGGGGDNGRVSEDNGREGKNGDQGPLAVCAVCRGQLSSSNNQEVSSPRLLPATRRQQPLFESHPALPSPSFRPSSRVCSSASACSVRSTRSAPAGPVTGQERKKKTATTTAAPRKKFRNDRPLF
ncbi:hypothetical protein PG994_002107 [Apiospora phragmitis]|uniref:Uncharacterized protein n=1 Tax=Apiospora phragmitis TaxID=2905665 RepID=A0ABR1WVI5_9PEZI